MKLPSLHDILRPEAPPARLGAVRVLVGLFASTYLLARMPALIGVGGHAASNFQPVGPVHLLSQPLPSAAVTALAIAAFVASIPFLLGWRFRFTAPVFAALLLWVLAYRNSFGMVFHTENLLVLHVIGLSLTDAAAAFSLDARRPGAAPREDLRHYGFALTLLNVMAVTAYFLAGVAKLRMSGALWATGDILRNQIAHDNLRKALLGDSYSPIGVYAIRHPWMFPPFAVLTLIIELGAPLALLGGRIGRLWALSIWAFHAGVVALMWIVFPYPLSFVAYAALFPVERLVSRVFERVGRRARPTEGEETT